MACSGGPTFDRVPFYFFPIFRNYASSRQNYFSKNSRKSPSNKKKTQNQKIMSLFPSWGQFKKTTNFRVSISLRQICPLRQICRSHFDKFHFDKVHFDKFVEVTFVEVRITSTNFLMTSTNLSNFDKFVERTSTNLSKWFFSRKTHIDTAKLFETRFSVACDCGQPPHLLREVREEKKKQ